MIENGDICLSECVVYFFISPSCAMLRTAFSIPEFNIIWTEVWTENVS